MSLMGRQGEFAGGWTGHSTVTARGHQYLPLDRLRMAGSRVQLTVALSASQSQVSEAAALRPPNTTVCSQSVPAIRHRAVNDSIFRKLLFPGNWRTTSS